jgi:hypothetical protein
VSAHSFAFFAFRSKFGQRKAVLQAPAVGVTIAVFSAL